jgi:hypothetical protein
LVEFLHHGNTQIRQIGMPLYPLPPLLQPDRT